MKRITDAEGNQWKVDPKVNSHMTQSWTHAFRFNWADCCVFAYLHFILDLLKPQIRLAPVIWMHQVCVTGTAFPGDRRKHRLPFARVCSLVNLMVSWRSASTPCSSATHTSASPFTSRCQLCARLHWCWSVPLIRKLLSNGHTALTKTRCAVLSVFEEVNWSQMLNWRTQNKRDLQPRIVLSTL